MLDPRQEAVILDPSPLFKCMLLMSGGFPRLMDGDPESVDAIFVWGRASGEWQATRFDQGVLDVAAKMYRQTNACVVIPGYVGADHGQGTTGYPGPAMWEQALLILGVPQSKIASVSGDGHNTKTEMDDFLAMALELRWRRIVAVTQQLHALRAMLGVVASLDRLKCQDVMVVPVWPERFDWARVCHGSQGQGPCPRTQWVDEEFNRIPRYQAQNDLATLDRLADYLRSVHQELSVE